MTDQNTLADLSSTPANNLNIKGQSQQGTAPANTIDNIFQRYGATLHDFYNSIGGVATVSGTDTYTVTITEDWAALASGLILAIKPANANTGAATLNVTVPSAGALGAKAIRRQGDTALSANDMLANGIYLLRYATSYNSAAGAWVLLNPSGGGLALDANSNLTANNLLSGYATAATAAGTTTLLVGSAVDQYFTGTTTQTVVLPVTSTLTLGQRFVIHNNSTGKVTVQSSGANTIQIMGGTGITFAPGAPGTKLLLTCISTSGTGTASWDYEYTPPITNWVAYTPTFTGFGTVSASSIFSRRVGDTLEVSGNFTAGTVTATEAQMTLGYNGTNANVTSDSAKVPSIQIAGVHVISVASASAPTMLIESGVGYLTFGRQTSTQSGLGKLNGSGLISNGGSISVSASVPISGW